MIGRFINADTADVLLVSPTSLNNKNLYSYCDNNPIMRIDSSGALWAEAAAIVVAGGIVGGILGAFSAACTGGNIFEGAIEGGITGAVGSVCGLLSVSPLAAAALGFGIDIGVQATSHYLRNNSMDDFVLDPWRSVKTGAQMGIGVAIPVLGKGAENVYDAFGTAFVWAEGSTLITFSDIAVTNAYNNSQPKSVGQSSSKKSTSVSTTTGRITGIMTTADYFRQQYNLS